MTTSPTGSAPNASARPCWSRWEHVCRRDRARRDRWGGAGADRSDRLRNSEGDALSSSPAQRGQSAGADPALVTAGRISPACPMSRRPSSANAVASALRRRGWKIWAQRADDLCQAGRGERSQNGRAVIGRRRGRRSDIPDISIGRRALGRAAPAQCRTVENYRRGARDNTLGRVVGRWRRRQRYTTRRDWTIRCSPTARM